MSEFDAKKRHMTRCARYAEIDWSATAKSNDTGRETEMSDVILDIDALKKYYQVSANALFSSAQKRVVKANETISLKHMKQKRWRLLADQAAVNQPLQKC